jgi:glycerophosphoryl diester phosphodiesterase
MRAALVVILAGVVLTGCVGCGGGPLQEPVPNKPLRPRIVAHRGASYEAPENTLAAFKRAWALGAEGVELDVRVSKDGQVVVFHDDTTKRIGGVDRAVADQTLAELRTLDVGAWKHAKYARERIPTLAEALATMPAGRTMFVEIKSSADTAPAVADVVRTAKPTSVAIALQAYDAAALAALAAALPDAPAYWTVDPSIDERGALQPYDLALIDETKRQGFAGLALDYRGVTPALLDAARDAGLLVDVWTINDADLLARWIGRDVRWIETDRPELAPTKK